MTRNSRECDRVSVYRDWEASGRALIGAATDPALAGLRVEEILR